MDEKLRENLRYLGLICCDQSEMVVLTHIN